MKNIIYVVRKGIYEGRWTILKEYETDVLCKNFDNEEIKEMIPRKSLRKLTKDEIFLLVVDQYDYSPRGILIRNTLYDIFP